MCVDLGCPLAVLLSGVCRVSCFVTAMLRASCLFKKPDWLKKVECQQSTIFKLPSVFHMANQNQKPSFVSDGEV